MMRIICLPLLLSIIFSSFGCGTSHKAVELDEDIIDFYANLVSFKEINLQSPELRAQFEQLLAEGVKLYERAKSIYGEDTDLMRRFGLKILELTSIIERWKQTK